MRYTRYVIPILVAAWIAGCAVLDGDLDVYEGTYDVGFEVNAFQPCDETETWWVVGPNSAVDRLVDQTLAVRAADSTRANAPVFVRLQGKPGPSGQYGNTGAYEREFSLQDVLEVRTFREGDCGS
ncbi:MAG: hypothetical protein R2834_17030 [Rhodothermales bacterium]